MFFKPKVNFLVIGAQKSGTSTLYRYITANLMITAAQQKEVHYFDLFYDKGKSWYHQNFELNSRSVSGEATPYYLFHPKAAERAYRYNPNFKLIAILRNPKERALSHYRMNVARGLEQLELKEALLIENERIGNSEPDKAEGDFQNFSYLKRGLYQAQIERWLEFFSNEQLLLLNFHQFISDPWQEVQKVYNFLGVAPFYSHDKYLENKGNDDLNLQFPEEFKDYFQGSNKWLHTNFGINFE